jgi:small subunit ribosomal protein S20
MPRESVDLGISRLYKGGNGGGRNPAAAVLWAAPAPSDMADGLFGTGLPGDFSFKDNQQRRSRGSSGRRAHAIKSSEQYGLRIFDTMANTTSAKKATRKIARRTAINKSRRTQMRGAVRRVEDAIKSGDRDAAVKAMASAEPELMRAAQRNIVHKNTASRKVSRLTHQIAKLGK